MKEDKTVNRYRLLKDLPGVKSGGVGDVNDSGILCFRLDDTEGVTMPHYIFTPDQIKNNPDFFELVPPLTDTKERIKVTNISFESNTNLLKVFTNGNVGDLVARMSIDKIMDNLNAALNDTVVEDSHEEKYYNHKIYSQSYVDNKVNSLMSELERCYDQKQVDTIRTQTWDAARNAFKVQIPNRGLGYGDLQFKYPTLEDYLKTLRIPLDLKIPDNFKEIFEKYGDKQPAPSTDTSVQRDKYLPLYKLVSECKGNPTIEQLKEIISIVKKDFPENENNY